MSRVKGYTHRRFHALSRIELVIIIVLIGIVTFSTGPQYSRSATAARIQTCKTNVALINIKADLQFLYYGVWPQSFDEFGRNPNYFPDGPVMCPYGEEYVMNEETHHVARHAH